MMLLASAVTGIKVEKPTFDLVGLVLGSFRTAGVLLLAAVVLGIVFGAALIVVRRLSAGRPIDAVSLRIAPPGQPSR